jgi:phosphoglycerol transferase MdoB-like AlkP superfamily enzyme
MKRTRTRAASRFRLIIAVILLFVLVSFVTRGVLLFTSFAETDHSIGTLLKVFGVGLFYDLVAAFYFVIPLVLYVTLTPRKLFNARWHRWIFGGILFATLYGVVFNAFAEWFFWEEFGKRFNFIAVDYLVYTHEVIHNILESYPIPLLLAVIFLITSGIFYLLWRRTGLFDAPFRSGESFGRRLALGAVFLLIPILSFVVLDKQPFARVSQNQYDNELAKNGLYSLFSAFRHNTLDYEEFYRTIPEEEMKRRLHRLTGLDPLTFTKEVRGTGKEKRYNVILIMVESLSAKYMGIYGNEKNLTPHLDALAKRSLFFDNLYATGTRTVRGMEAVTLSVPPTPGRSIVKRPDSHGLYSAGFLFDSRGYESKFIYAGYGYFDNMNDFFSHNGFEIVDRADFEKEEITFANVWGVCDEDLFRKVIKEADRSYAGGNPFFSFVMTTSNHRPYTYPEGRIDIPSHTGRDGAVKYTDYAIGTFIEEASKKPWFDETIFVILADHNGGSAGKTSLPLHRYRIPLILYAPGILKPRRISRLASQIDVIPTILARMGWSYTSRFFGDDILASDYRERAFIGNYQKLGYLVGDLLTILFPDKSVHGYRIVQHTLTRTRYEETAPDENLSRDAIAYYQGASYMYTHGLDRWIGDDNASGTR